MAERTCPACQAKIDLTLSKDADKITCGGCGKTYTLKPSAKNGKKAPPPAKNGKKVPPPAKNAKPVDKKTKIDNMILELAVTYGMITNKQAANVGKMQEKLKQSGNYIPADKLLQQRGLISEKQIEHLHLSRTFLELRDQDALVANLAEQKGILTKKDIRQSFATQLKLFKEKKIVGSVSDIFIKLSLMTKEEREEIYKELDLKIPGEEEEEEAEDDEIKEEDIDFQDVSQVTEYEINDDTRLYVTNDLMAAFIEVTDDFFKDQQQKTEDIAEEILDFVREQDIVYGITGTSFVVNVLETDLFKKQKRFKIASGNKPIIGRDASIKYFFETNYQRPGTITKGGLIDFKNRGEVPFVQKGDLLAEKTPIIEGQSGRDIKGYEIVVEEYKDVYFESGTGTELSEDGTKIFASIDGQPDVSVKKVISVYPELQVKGDVDYSTGHIEFDGNVEITGTVKNGFKVTCCNLTAKEIIGAEINITGDLNVSGGIIQATIKTEGNIKAFYIQQSNIFGYGSLTVANEIIDSDIGINGECKSNSCKIFASEVSAKRGFDVKQIGNKMTDSCIIKAGKNEKFENLLSRKTAIMEDKKKNLDEVTEAFNAQMDKQKTLIGSLTGQVLREELAENEQKSILQDIETTKAEVAKSGKTGDRQQLIKLKEAYKKQDKILFAAKERTKKIFNAQSVLIDEILMEYNYFAEAEEEYQTIKTELELLEARYEKDAPRPLIKVTGILTGGTKVFGTNASVEINGDVKSAKVIELREKPQPGSESKSSEYKMDIQRI